MVVGLLKVVGGLDNGDAATGGGKRGVLSSEKDYDVERELELEIVDVEDNAGKAPLRKSMAVGRILMGS